MIRRIYSFLPWSFQEGIKFLKYFFGFGLDEFSSVGSKFSPDKTVVVLGMHRSGTSVVANIISELNFNFGKHMLEPSKDNELGFFENRDFIRLNNYLLAKAGGMWHLPPGMNKILNLSTSRRINSKVRSVVLRNQDRLWGWKDPRTVLTLPLFLKHLVNPYFIIVRRNHDSVAKSLFKREGIPMLKGIDLSKEYNKRLDLFIRENRQAMILDLNFEDIVKDEGSAVSRIRDFLGVSKKIGRVINKDLVHN